MQEVTNAVHHAGEAIAHSVTNVVQHAGKAAAHAAEGAGHSITHTMMHLILQLAVIIIVAKVGGYLFHRFLKMPSVLGELASGMVIGPYALGSRIDLPGLGLLFVENHCRSSVPPVSTSPPFPSLVFGPRGVG